MESSKRDEWTYNDPHESEKGVLLANRIHELCDAGLLISENYEPKNLRPASYTLRIGDDFIDGDGNRKRLTENDISFVFPKNSIIFVTTKEKFALPFYVIARFNLRVNWVYDGVLLGTGPQVDPGFTGFLSCPLYNLTNSDIAIQRGEDFATIDFEKTTTPLADLPWQERKEIITAARDKELVKLGPEKHSFYKVPALKPLQHRKAHKIVSSLLEMRDEVRTWRNLGIGSLIAFFGLTVSLLSLGANLYRQNTDMASKITDYENRLRQANDRIAALEDHVNRIPSVSEQNAPEKPSSKLANRKGDSN